MKPGHSLILAAFLALALVSQSQDWKQIGPDPIQDSALLPATPNATVSGLVSDIAIDPRDTNDSVIYIATAAGGVWKTTNGGSSWSSKTDFLHSLTLGAVALDPEHPDIVYAGVGGPYCCTDNGGIQRSRNQGTDWTELNPNGVFTFIQDGVPTAVQINRIVLPAHGVLLVATDHGLFKSVDSGDHFGNNAPVGNNTHGFDNSQPIPITTPQGILSSNVISDLKLDTATPTTVYAALQGQGIFKSTDSGTTFPASGEMLTSANLLPGVTGFSFVTFAQSTHPDNQTFYVTVAVNTGQPLGPPFCSALPHSYVPALAMFRSVNGGVTWPKRIKLGADVTASLQGAGGYDQTIGVDPQDAKRVYIGLRGLFESSDGGDSGFYDSSNGCHNPSNGNNRIDINKAHADQHAIYFSPNNHAGQTTRVFTGNDGGFASTAAQGSSPGHTWQLLNHGLATALLYDMDMGRGSAANNAYTYSAAQDNSISVKTPGQAGTNDWEQTGCCGDAFGVAVDPTNPLRAMGLDGSSFTFTTDALDWAFPNVIPGGVSRVRFDPNGGNAYALASPPTWASKQHYVKNALIVPPSPQSNNNKNYYRQTAPACVSGSSAPTFNTSQGSSTPDHTCAWKNKGGAGSPLLYQSKNKGTSFSLMHTFPQNASTMSQVKGDPNTIWVGLDDGTVQVTHDAQNAAASAWTARTVNGAPTNEAVSGIAIDPVHTKTVVVVYPGFSECLDSVSGSNVPCGSASALPPKHVFLTTDDGMTWKNHGGTAGGGDSNLPDLPLNAVVIVPFTSPHAIVVGSDAGVLQSADLGKTWQVLGTGFPNVSVRALAFDPDVQPLRLRAATFGRSVFELGGSCPLCPPLPQCTSRIDCDGNIESLSCLGPNVFVLWNGNCHYRGVTYEEPLECAANSHGTSSLTLDGSSTPPLTDPVDFRDRWEPLLSVQVCTQSGVFSRCMTYPDPPTVPTCIIYPTNGPPPLCPQNEAFCDRINPPRCVTSGECPTVTPNHPPPH